MTAESGSAMLRSSSIGGCLTVGRVWPHISVDLRVRTAVTPARSANEFRKDLHMRIPTAVVLGLLCCSVPAEAQARRTYWGISGGAAPQWEVPSAFKTLFDANSLNFDGWE